MDALVSPPANLGRECGLVVLLSAVLSFWRGGSPLAVRTFVFIVAKLGLWGKHPAGLKGSNILKFAASCRKASNRIPWVRRFPPALYSENETGTVIGLTRNASDQMLKYWCAACRSRTCHLHPPARCFPCKRQRCTGSYARFLVARSSPAMGPMVRFRALPFEFIVAIVEAAVPRGCRK